MNPVIKARAINEQNETEHLELMFHLARLMIHQLTTALQTVQVRRQKKLLEEERVIKHYLFIINELYKLSKKK